MDTRNYGARECDRETLRQIFQQWERWPGPEAKFKVVPVADRQEDRYLLLSIGWDGHRRIYSVLVHVDIVDGMFWIQRDQTDSGIATDLMAAGVPKDRIVLAFRSPEMRALTDFAVG
jgi:hypothetical protein